MKKELAARMRAIENELENLNAQAKAIAARSDELKQEVRAIRALQLMDCAIEQQFPKRDYVRIAKWLQTDSGKIALPDYHTMTWEQRAEALTTMLKWDVDSHHLMVAINRL